MQIEHEISRHVDLLTYDMFKFDLMLCFVSQFTRCNIKNDLNGFLRCAFSCDLPPSFLCKRLHASSWVSVCNTWVSLRTSFLALHVGHDLFGLIYVQQLLSVHNSAGHTLFICGLIYSEVKRVIDVNQTIYNVCNLFRNYHTVDKPWKHFLFTTT